METVKYTYISSVDYINSLEFDYLETYSLLRGEEFELLTIEYEELEERKEEFNNLTSIEEKRFLELDELFGFRQYLINEQGEFHPSSKKTHTFKQNDEIVEKLKSILRTEVKQIPSWMCAPEYRDAIVFYDKNNQIVSCLNVCLSCEYMETEMFTHINGDYETYDLLKRFFIEIGHDVENPDTFTWEDLQNQILKK